MKAKTARVIAQIACACLLTLVDAGCSKARQPTQGRALPVDEVAFAPEKFSGVITVAGTVAKVDPANHMFVLGCEDACVALPVKYAGTLPAMKRDVVVRGQVKQTAQGNYVFDAQAVESK